MAKHSSPEREWRAVNSPALALMNLLKEVVPSSTADVNIANVGTFTFVKFIELV